MRPYYTAGKIPHCEFEELDDFVYVWETFELDDLMTRFKKPRIWSDEKYWFKDQYVWDLYMERMALDYKKKVLKDPAYHDSMTTLVEFARGGENAIHHALTFLSDEMLSRASLMYIKVPVRRICAQESQAGAARPGRYHSLSLVAG